MTSSMREGNLSGDEVTSYGREGNLSGDEVISSGREGNLSGDEVTPSGKGGHPAGIMVQGTMSGVGKSLVSAALCRYFHREGLRVSPFKSQNMSLNSFVTADGCEIGRAQALQAMACHREPSASMNPILLKPVSDKGSQVVINGKPVGNYSAQDYYRFRAGLKDDIIEAYKKLESESDLIVIEGAGSPAEINLMENDIVNMGLSEMTDTPVILVGDIDRGGVFAQLYGTMELLPEKWKRRIKGFVINKFRGDRSILEPGIREIENKCKVPVLGVLPYIENALDDEDSLSGFLSGSIFRTEKCRGVYSSEDNARDFNAENGDPAGDNGINLDIAVIRFPRISNFTDLSYLRTVPGYDVRFVGRASDLGQPDMVVLPGTKNTIADLRWLKYAGLGDRVKALASSGTLVFGICGGYQMLGKSVSDPFGMEEGGRETGLGLLDAETVIEKQKVLRRSRGRFADRSPSLFAGFPVEGYEIHMGETVTGEEPLCILQDIKTGDIIKEGSCRGNICGTCIHGIFDCIVPGREKKVLEDLEMDRVTDLMTGSMDMRAVRRIAGC